MRLLLVCVGRAKGPEHDITERYLTRAAAAGRTVGLSEIKLREIDESRARRPQDRQSEEAKAIRAALGPAARFIACDETGENLSSPAFAAAIGRMREENVAALGIVIGGADGLDPALRSAASLVLAFGAMTWPHQLARSMAAEQIYRATTILTGHPYHRA